MKTLFLDFDGVLNSTDWFQRSGGDWNGHRDTLLDPKAVQVLNEIVAADVKVVVSSTWRLIHKLPKLKDLLAQAGFSGRVIGTTPSIPYSKRQEEIQSWLNRHPEVTAYVILDDDGDAVIPGHFVQTDNTWGLKPEHVARCQDILNG